MKRVVPLKSRLPESLGMKFKRYPTHVEAFIQALKDAGSIPATSTNHFINEMVGGCRNNVFRRHHSATLFRS